MIRIFCLECCPHCEVVKKFFDEHNIEYETMLADTAEGITELRVGGCFEIEMPVVYIGSISGNINMFFINKDLFTDGELNTELLFWMGSHQ